MRIEPKSRYAAVTICAINYLGKALVLRDSYLASHPDSDFYIVIVDKKAPDALALKHSVAVLWAEDLGIADFAHYAFKFDIVELSTNVKPASLRLLLAHYHTVLYIDPDIVVYAALTPVLESLQHHSIVVTPHSLTPILDGKNPSDVDFSRFGSFNLGFIGVTRCEEAFRFLDWWSERCLTLGYYEPQIGLAVDQKWMDLAPCYFAGLGLLRDPGLNVAFWNLHERHISRKDGRWCVNGLMPLYFFHFSSFMVNDPHGIAHKQSRFTKGSRPDLHDILDDYARRLLANQSDSYAATKYSFDFFEDGTYISPTLRRIYASLEDRVTRSENPFLSHSRVYRFAFRRHLASRGFTSSHRYTFRNLEHFSVGIRLLGFCLRVLLRLLGPNRYFVLMKYLAFISSIRNQRLFRSIE